MTDEFWSYKYMKKDHASHTQLKHGVGQFRVGDKHTNTVEGYFAILKRGINGIYHHVGRKHIHRYLDEFDFRYSSRNIYGRRQNMHRCTRNRRQEVNV